MESKIKKKFERAKKELEQEKKQTYGIYLNKKAVQKASRELKISPKKLITNVFENWLFKCGYLENKKRTAVMQKR